MLAAAFSFLFGPPRTIALLRILAALSRLCPCPATDAACPAHHQRAAAAIVLVVEDDRDPEDAAALLLGTGAHETGFRTEHQVKGPGVTYWQHEVPVRERAALLADVVLAARRALRIARSGMAAYAGCEGRTAEELRRYVWSARWALAASG